MIPDMFEHIFLGAFLRVYRIWGCNVWRHKTQRSFETRGKGNRFDIATVGSIERFLMEANSGEVHEQAQIKLSLFVFKLSRCDANNVRKSCKSRQCVRINLYCSLHRIFLGEFDSISDPRMFIYGNPFGFLPSIRTIHCLKSSYFSSSSLLFSSYSNRVKVKSISQGVLHKSGLYRSRLRLRLLASSMDSLFIFSLPSSRLLSLIFVFIPGFLWTRANIEIGNNKSFGEEQKYTPEGELSEKRWLGNEIFFMTHELVFVGRFPWKRQWSLQQIHFVLCNADDVEDSLLRSSEEIFFCK